MKIAIIHINQIVKVICMYIITNADLQVPAGFSPVTGQGPCATSTCGTDPGKPAPGVVIIFTCHNFNLTLHPNCPNLALL